MNDKRSHTRSHLFTVRLWIGRASQDRTEIRGKVQHVVDGDVIYFRTWMALTDFLSARIHEAEETALASAEDCMNDLFDNDI